MKYLFGLLMLLVIFSVSAQEDVVERLPQPSQPFPQWAYWSPTDDTILVSNGKTMQLYSSDFYLLRDIRLVPEDIDADREQGLDLLFRALWHPTGQWILIQDLFKMEIWNADLTIKLYTSPPQGSIDQRMIWHSQKPWLALTSYNAPIRIYDFMARTDVAMHEGWVITGVAWWPGTDKLAFTDNDGFTVWDVVQNTFTHPPLPKWSEFVFNRTGTLLLDTDYGDIVIFRTDTWQQEMRIHPTNNFYNFAWVGDDKVAGLEINQNLSIWDISTQQQLSSYLLPKSSRGMSWNMSGSKFLLITSRDEDITVRDTNTGEVLASLKAALDGAIIPPMPTSTP